MAVYTHLGAEDLAALIRHYDVGDLVSAKGIAEGVSNSNWLIETTGKGRRNRRFILTMYERRIELSDLPYFLGLLDHLSAKGCPVPRTIHDKEGNAFRFVDAGSDPDEREKAVALIEFLPGVSIDHPTPAQALSVGMALAQSHLAVADFKPTRFNDMGLAQWNAAIESCGEAGLASIHPDVAAFADTELQCLSQEWPEGLPHGAAHCDLFPDNVLMLGDEVSGLIDFYFAATEFFAYDLAVTHAAWSFEPGGADFREDVGSALLEGYESVRPLSRYEREALPTLARGACMRFVMSRAEDWLTTPDDALVAKKDPMEFVKRSRFYARWGDTIFSRKA
jgi:homoserine kinase type II